MSFSKVLIAGFVATLLMTVACYSTAVAVGAPVFDFSVFGAAARLGSPGIWSSGWWFRMVEHFINGTVLFPLVYCYLLYSWLPGGPVFRGLLFGFFLWFGSQITIMPLMGFGIFAERSREPLATLLITLNSHLVYGGVLGIIARRRGLAPLNRFSNNEYSAQDKGPQKGIHSRKTA